MTRLPIFQLYNVTNQYSDHYFMDCSHCQTKKTQKLSSKTALGYQQYRVMAVYLYYRFKNSLDDVVELMAMRGMHLSHQTIYNWTHRFGVELAIKLRNNSICKAGFKWHMDTTYLRVEAVGAICIVLSIKKVT